MELGWIAGLPYYCTYMKKYLGDVPYP